MPSDPVVEKIAQVIFARLKDISTDAGYNYTPAKVIRPGRTRITSPEHLLVTLVQGVPIPDEENSIEGWGYRVAAVMPYAIGLYVKPSDDDSEPLDAILNRFSADVCKAVATVSAGDWAQFDGNAHNAAWGEPSLFEAENGAYLRMDLILLVTYRVYETNPYTQG